MGGRRWVATEKIGFGHGGLGFSGRSCLSACLLLPYCLLESSKVGRRSLESMLLLQGARADHKWQARPNMAHPVVHPIRELQVKLPY